VTVARIVHNVRFEMITNRVAEWLIHRRDGTMRRISGALGFAAATLLASGVAAQTSTTTTTQKSTAMNSPKTVTVVGCLQTASDQPSQYVFWASPAGSEAAATSGSSSTTSSSTSSTGMTKDTTSTTTMTADKGGQKYRITAGPGVSLTEHVGHRVQLMGTTSAMAGASQSSMSSTKTTTSEPRTGEPSETTTTTQSDAAGTTTQSTTKSPTGMSSTATTTTKSSSASAADFASAPELIVTSVKHVSADCK
jgi:hypothetical protein